MNPPGIWKTAVYVAAFFMVGAVTGAMIAVGVMRENRFHAPRAPDMSQRMLASLTARLDLTPEQVQKIDPIIQKASADLKGLYDETHKRAGGVMDAAYAQIGAVLTPAQKEKLQVLKNERHPFPPPGATPGGQGDPHHHHHPRPDGMPTPGRSATPSEATPSSTPPASVPEPAPKAN